MILRGGRSPERRIGVFYLTQFMSGGVLVAYAGIWFAAKGFGEQQIGILNASPILLLLLINLVVGRLADRASDWRQAVIAGAMAAAVLPLGLFLDRDEFRWNLRSARLWPPPFPQLAGTEGGVRPPGGHSGAGFGCFMVEHPL